MMGAVGPAELAIDLNTLVKMKLPALTSSSMVIISSLVFTKKNTCPLLTLAIALLLKNSPSLC
jgi:hypothetical protein